MVFDIYMKYQNITMSIIIECSGEIVFITTHFDFAIIYAFERDLFRHHTKWADDKIVWKWLDIRSISRHCTSLYSLEFGARNLRYLMQIVVRNCQPAKIVFTMNTSTGWNDLVK